jgi:Leucine-rich repeat (LRR) protein
MTKNKSTCSIPVSLTIFVLGTDLLQLKKYIKILTVILQFITFSIVAQDYKKVSLSNSDLTSIPDSIYLMTDLIELDLSINNIVSIDSNIGNLTKLQFLNLNINKLNNFPKEIIRLKNLEVLLIEGNNIKIIPPEIGFMTSLTKFSIGSTHMGSNPVDSLPKQIGNLVNLKKLYLTYCGLKYLPDEIGNLQMLEVLTLKGNGLKKLPSTINNLKSLKILTLEGNEIEEVPYIGDLIKLEELRLTGTYLEELPDGIKNLKNLKEISVNYKLLKPLLKITKKLPSLEEITIAGVDNIKTSKLEKIKKRYSYIHINGF